MTLVTPLTTLILIGLPVAIGAGLVRGFSGFGFSALTVAGVSLFMAPTALVPAVLTLEVVASLSVWRAAVRELDATWLRPLIIGNAVFVPIGVLMLVHLPGVLLRFVVGLALLLTAAGLRLRGEQPVRPSAAVKAATGVLSGLLNGLAASGGIAAALMLTAANVPPLVLRGTIIAYLLFACGYALLCNVLVAMASGADFNLFGPDTLIWMAVLAPGMFLGMWLGRRAFAIANPKRFRKLVLDLLILMSGLGVVRALFDMV